MLKKADPVPESIVHYREGFMRLDEKARLADLAYYNILDTAPEQGFDDIVLLAAQICETPVSLVSLVGADRQWFKARTGLDQCETPLSQSICSHGLQIPGLLIIPDLTKDPRTEANTLVIAEPFLRFYAGARLETPNGFAIGMLCVIDTEPRPNGLSGEQARALEALARQVMTQMELRRVAAERELLVQEAHHRVKNSLQMIQSLLSMQARMTAHPEAAQQLRESASRVNAFGTMHEHLYRTGATVEVNLGIYLQDLIELQRTALVSPLGGRDISFESMPASWPASDAPTIGLILMELVTNSLKYGAGLIAVTLDRLDDMITLRVGDEGTGLPDSFDPSDSKGLGMRVVTGLLKGRQGRLSIDRSRIATCFVATLRAPST